jgi:hypothetical protein
MNDQAISTLQQSVHGRLIGRNDSDYDDARALYNGMMPPAFDPFGGFAYGLYDVNGRVWYLRYRQAF